MNWIFSSREVYDPGSYDAKEGRYEGYRGQNLANGYQAYGENGVAEAVYDRYDYTYETESTIDQKPKQSCCKRVRSCCSDMGRLI